MLLTYFLHVHSRNGYSPSDIPNPMANPESAAACGRPGVSKSAICDPANLLSNDSKDISEEFLNGIDKVKVALLVVNKISSDYVGHDTINAASEKFARVMHDTWEVQDKSMENGVLIFLSIDDRVVYISTGNDSGRVLSSAVIDAIISRITPDFQSAQYGSAVEKAVLEIGLVFGRKYIDPAQSASDKRKRGSRALKFIFGEKTEPFVRNILLILFFGIAGFGGFFTYLESLKNKRLERGETDQTLLNTFSPIKLKTQLG